MEDLFKDTAYGKAALAKLNKLAPVAEGFMLYDCGWVNYNPKCDNIMCAIGAVFREAKSGINKGKRTVIVRETIRKTYVTESEIAKFI